MCPIVSKLSIEYQFLNKLLAPSVGGDPLNRDHAIAREWKNMAQDTFNILCNI